ncbi:MAG: hypothetical protein A3G09_04475 [Candidatus Moranbacteria bacterium RIFCSPLOWO2_12_FULL_48_12]|nr:MAG: hypothetical protein A3G09_04475 [Candidatus Moranbacteria bacterium RIFCSPLOWO2_12_FULL_48_12]
MLTQTKQSSSERKLLRDILAELRLLRAEFSLFLPSENLSEYASPTEIKRLFKKALKTYPLAKR